MDRNATILYCDKRYNWKVTNLTGFMTSFVTYQTDEVEFNFHLIFEITKVETGIGFRSVTVKDIFDSFMKLLK